MLLEHLGEKAAADRVLQGIEASIHEKMVTRDMGGSASTSGVGDWIADWIKTS
ncbi:MAG: Homoisocitrate dehydrogenase [Euryarchaeota archaeon ADurb.Bin165]|nr:MAG: Homoisocitrate dehydrogenase [Euryarchaeota archaeon ADurb.Bin165]